MCDAEAFENGGEHVGFHAQSGCQAERGGVVVADGELVHFRDTAFRNIEAQAGVACPDPAELPLDIAPG